MADPKIIQYIKNTLSQGYGRDEIKDALLNQGWSEHEIAEAMAIAAPEPGKGAEQPEKAQKPEILKKEESKPITVKKEAPGQEQSKRAPKEPSFSSAFAFTLVGGALVLVNSLLIYIMSIDLLLQFFVNTELSAAIMMGVVISPMDSFIINLVIGGFLIGLAYIIHAMPDKSRLVGIFVLAVSSIAVFVGNGFLLGGFIGILGGILALLRK